MKFKNYINESLDKKLEKSINKELKQLRYLMAMAIKEVEEINIMNTEKSGIQSALERDLMRLKEVEQTINNAAMYISNWKKP